MCALLIGGAAVADPVVDPRALEASFEMLHLQMKMRVVELYYSRADFYIPPEWPRAYQAEYDLLADRLGGMRAERLRDMETWREESRAAQTNEVLQCYELAEQMVEACHKIDTARNQAADADLNELKDLRRRNATKLEVSRFVTNLTGRIAAANSTDNAGGGGRNLQSQWNRNMVRLHRGAVRDSIHLGDEIAAYDRNRMEVDARMEFLKNVEEGMNLAKAVREPVEKLKEMAEEQAISHTQKWLETKYTDMPPDGVKDMCGKLKKDWEHLSGIYDKARAFEEDLVLKANPTALAAAQRMTILAGLYSYTLGKVRDQPCMQAFGPMLDVLEFYGEAVTLVPVVAVKMQTWVTAVDQYRRGVRLMCPWNVTKMPPGQLEEFPLYLNKLGLQIAHDTDSGESGLNARYYMLVPTEVVDRGYATLSYDQMKRMTQAIADERFMNAPGEVSRSVTDIFLEVVALDKASTTIGARNASAPYLDKLKDVCRKTPFTTRQLLDLAYDKGPVECGLLQVTADSLRSSAELVVDRLAEEMTLREALIHWDKTSTPDHWKAYTALLTRYGVAFAPAQLLNLFNFYEQGPDRPAKLEAYLKRVVGAYEARKKGQVAAGIPVIVPEAAGQAVKLTADVLISELAPGRAVEAEVTWEVKGTPPPPPQKVKLVNGVQPLTLEVALPPGGSAKAVKARVVVKVTEPPPEDLPPLPESLPPLPPEPVSREFVGNTVDAPYRVAAKSPTVTVVYGLAGSVSAGQVQGVEIRPAPDPDAFAWEIHRAISPDGPWVPIADHYWKTATQPFVDPLPGTFSGQYTWYYVALPKTAEQSWRLLPGPEFSAWTSVTLDLQIAPPVLTVQVLPWEEARLLSLKPAEVTAAKTERTRQREEGRESIRAIADERERSAAQQEVDIEERDRRFAEAREIVLRWPPPERSEMLKRAPVDAQIFRAFATKGPFQFVASVDAASGFWRDEERHLPGQPVYYQARFLARTALAAIASDWACTAAVAPTWRYFSNRRSDGLITVPVGPGQRLRLWCRAAVSVPDTPDYEKYFRPHDAGGMNEQTFSTYSSAEIARRTAQFWAGYSGQHTPEREAELVKKLGAAAKIFYPDVRARAPVADAPLLALIGRFVPRGDGGKSDETRAAWITIGNGTDFAAPEAGVLQIYQNWPGDVWRVEKTTELLLEVASLNQALMPADMPVIETVLARHVTDRVLEPPAWKVELHATAWTPAPGLRFRLFTARSAAGPWFPAGEWTEAPPLGRTALAEIGRRGVFRLCEQLRTDGSLLAETWSEPVTCQVPPAPLQVGFERSSARVYGRAGETLRVNVTGTWVPFRYPGVRPHGPEGIDEATLRKFVTEFSKSQKDAKPARGESLLGNTMAGGAAAGTPDFSRIEDFVLRRGSFPGKEFPAGALVAAFSLTRPSDTYAGMVAPFDGNDVGIPVMQQVTRNWEFEFPADGFVSFFENSSRNWTGSPAFAGSGLLALNLSLTPAAGEDKGWVPASWGWPPPPAASAGELPELEEVPDTPPYRRPARAGTSDPSQVDGGGQPARPAAVPAQPAPAARGVPALPAEPRRQLPVEPVAPPPPPREPTPEQQPLKQAEQAAQLATASYSVGRPAEAEPAARQAAALAPAVPDYAVLLGHVLYAQQKHTEALAAYSNALALRPDDPDILANLAGVNYSMQQREAAYAFAGRAAAKGNTTHWIMPRLAAEAAAAGNAAFAAQRWKDALNSYQWAVTLEPGSGVGQANLAGALIMLNREAEARVAAAKALQLGFRGPNWVFDRLGLH